MRLRGPSVSRRHATLRVDDDKAVLEDDASNRNGTWVDDAKLRAPLTIDREARIRLGDEVLILIDREASEERLGGTATRPIPKLDAARYDAVEALSPREREVLAGIARGETQKAIADTLGVSVKTVETYRARIGEKLDLRTRADLVKFALDVGILRPDET